MATTQITEQNFESLIDKGGIVVIDWWAEWCNPCRMFAPVFEEASERHPDIVWGKVNTEEERGLARSFQIMSIPTLMIFRDGFLIFEQAGLVPAKALDDLMEQVRKVDMDAVKKEFEAQQAKMDAEEQEAFGAPEGE